MITSVYVWEAEEENEKDDVVFTTSGCGCCSDTLYASNSKDKEEIIAELKRNIEVVKRSCELLGIDYKEFVL